MNLHLHFILVNSEFNQGIANDLHGGQESEDNINYLWEDEFKVSESVEEFKIKNNTTYLLAGTIGENAFSFEIPEMTVCECITEKGDKMQFSVSKKLLKQTKKITDETKQETHLYFYLKDSLPMENPMDGVYIFKQDFPKELRKTQV